MRICILYDCLYPWTVGGAERWYRNLAERLAAEGHTVTYVTMRQWDPGDEPRIPGVRVVAVAPRMALYVEGRRRIAPPLAFGAGVLAHLARHGRDYDVVHTASFPYFSLLAAGLVRIARRFRLVVDWHEVWSESYWREYLGAAGGRIGLGVQLACARIPHRAFCFSRLHRDRLLEEGFRGEVSVLEGEYAGSLDAPPAVAAEPLVVFAGRHIPEKRAPAVVPAVARARAQIPELQGIVFGDGPQRPDVLAAISASGAEEFVSAPGFVDFDEVDAAMRRALCMVLPSSREGYGLVVVEASARGVPAVVVRGEDNAAVELVDDGENGVIADSASPQDLAAAIVRVHAEGEALRARTRAWFVANATRLSLAHSLDVVVEAYGASVRS